MTNVKLNNYLCLKDRGNVTPAATIHFRKTMLIEQGNRRQSGGEMRRR